jgi:hypothetical protein
MASQQTVPSGVRFGLSRDDMTMNVVGTWQLLSTSAVTVDGDELPAPYGGESAMGSVVLSAAGRMMAVLIDGSLALQPGTSREYTSYCGGYTFDGKQLITRVDAASDPARLGTDQIRDVSFNGDLMVLRPPLQSYGGLSQQRELHWRKISDT